MVLDDPLAAFLESGHSVIVATRSAALAPTATRACALQVFPPDRIALLLPRATSAAAVHDLRENGCVAISVSSPRDYRTVQLKGRSIDIAEASVEDVLLAEDQLRSFADAVAQFGLTRAQARNLWSFDGWWVTVQVTAAFAQTPGPGAGAPLGKPVA